MSWLLNNFWYKALSLFLALVVWVIIQGEQVLELNREIIVNLAVPDGYMIRGDTVRALAATIKGPRVMVMETPRTLEARVKVPALKGKRYRVRIDGAAIRKINPRLALTIHNPYFYVYVDERATRTLPVRYVPHGTPADGHFIKKVILNPSHVKITGLKSDIQKIRDVVTEPVDVTRLKQNQSIEVPILPPAGILPHNLSENTTVVTLQVGDSFINQRFGSIPIEIVGRSLITKLRPKYASIVIQGTPGTLKFVKKDDLKAFVEVRDLGVGRYEREIQVKIPQDTVLIESFPKKATVFIMEKDQDESELEAK